jgi:DNA-binding Lrp family transcriptional regulator
MSAIKVRGASATSEVPAAPTATAQADSLHTLDRIDRAILRQLQTDASISNVALAAKVKLSAPACLRRVERLKESGLIRGVVALIDPKAAGAGMLVIIGVVLNVTS